MYWIIYEWDIRVTQLEPLIQILDNFFISVSYKNIINFLKIDEKLYNQGIASCLFLQKYWNHNCRSDCMLAILRSLVLRNTATHIHLHMFYGCFCTAAAEVDSCERDNSLITLLYDPQNLKYLLPKPLQKFADPSSR